LPYDTLEKLQRIRKELTKDDNEDFEDPSKVEEEDEDLDASAPLSGNKKNELSTRANEIIEEELKREEIIKTLKDNIAGGISSDRIHQNSWTFNLFQSPPEGVILPAKKLHVIEDYFEMYPSFDDILFCSLDY